MCLCFLQTKIQEEEPLGFGQQVLHQAFHLVGAGPKSRDPPSWWGLGPDPGVGANAGRDPRDPQLAVLTA